MIELPWSAFRDLAGDPTKNFELLCREAVRRRYERYGPLLTRKQQPGVEFHLPVQRPGSELGDPPAHWGWQCRWYDPEAFRVNGRLRAAQREKIQAAIARTRVHVPDITDWVLWTRDKLNADDARWFDGLEAPFTLHRWDEETLVGLLSGPGESLLEAWFGTLVLADDRLVQLREQALAPIRSRYNEELHVRTPVETDALRSFLFDEAAVTQVLDLETDLLTMRERLLRWGTDGLVDDECAAVEQMDRVLRELAAGIRAVGELVDGGALPTAANMHELTALADYDDDLHTRGLRSLRRQDHPRALARDLARTLADARGVLHFALSHLHDTERSLATPLVAIAGGAGAGKTHLAAEISGPDRAPRGVLLLGQQFGAEIADDDLARAAGLGDRSRDDLIEALEALGTRQGRRVPLVIDGLNEADAPGRWRTTLARLDQRLREAPHVIGVVTVRPSYVAATLPDHVPRLDLPGLTGVVEQAVRHYFDYYRIAVDHRCLHWWPPSQPLLLSIFCRTVNPGRERIVTAEELPQSLTEVLTRYLDDACERIASRMGIEPAAVGDGLSALAYRFFERGTRRLERQDAHDALGDHPRDRLESLLRFQLESEEILTRDMIGDRERVLWSYDLLGGHAIARSLLERHAPEELRDLQLLAAIERHPLREDLVVGLGGLLSERGVDLAQIVAARPELQAVAALALPRLPAAGIDDGMVDSFARAFPTQPTAALEALVPTTFVPRHPLNATVLDRLLGDLPVWERDLTWTEWVRGRTSALMRQVRQLAYEWAESGEAPADDAQLAWLSWLLTTTDKRLNDEAVHALYRLGRVAPERLFARALALLDCNDRGVAAGLLAAAYGVAMAAQDPASDARAAVVSLARSLDERLLREGAAQPTAHWLIREYAFRIAQLAGWLSDDAVEPPSPARQPQLPQPAGAVPRFTRDGAEWDAVDGAFQMDFANYTIGRLIPERGNYDDDHPLFVEVTGEIRARVAQLGWTEERFQRVDREIAEQDFERGDDPEKVERYGKKYAWIGFYEAAGRLSDAGALQPEGDDAWRLSDVPLDPSFPDPAPHPPFVPPRWVDATVPDDEMWVRHGTIDVPETLLRPAALGDDEGPWIALDGFVRHQPHGGARKVFCFVRGMLALDGWDAVAQHVDAHGVNNRLVPSNDADYYAFAGEAPWAPAFGALRTDLDGSVHPCVVALDADPDDLDVELLAVEYDWERYHSALNCAGGISLPAKALAQRAGMRMLPGGSTLVDRNGRVVARAFRLSGEWSGHLLYVRESVLLDYSRERRGEYGWIAWGERELMATPAPGQRSPGWLSEVRRAGEDRFHRVVSLAEVAAARAPDAAPAAPPD